MCEFCVFVAEEEGDKLLKEVDAIGKGGIYMVYSTITGYHYMDFETSDGDHDEGDYRILRCPFCGRKFERFEP